MDPAFHQLRPWNEGGLIGAKRALKQQQVWAIRFWLDQHRRLRDRALSTSPSTASCAAVMWSGCGSAM
jgi:hypothetical protein